MGVMTMAKAPRTGESAPLPIGPGTGTVRVNGDLAYMISWICELEEIKSPQLMDPLIRPQILARFEKHRETVEGIEELKRKGRRPRE
jgi:hypothetical protein